MSLGEWLEWRLGRAACRVFGLHGRGCRGRRDHARPGQWAGHTWAGRGRWVNWL